MSEARSEAVLVHFYRAVVAHMDVWRQRMDATTNWAAATAAGMITFTFSSAATPHYVLLLALAFQLVFLIMESRRYQTFDLWRRRFRLLNRALIVPTLSGAVREEREEAALQEVARDMGRTVPHIGLRDAIGYRVRRNYAYLLAVTLLAWVMKLEIQPEAAHSLRLVIGRASVAFIPGWVVVAAVGAGVGVLLFTSARAPTGDMLNWEATEPTWHRVGAWARGARRSSPRPDQGDQ